MKLMLWVTSCFKRVRRIALLGVVLLAGCFALLCLYHSSTPAGWYYEAGIGSIDPAYFVFENREFHLRIVGLDALDKLLGTYSKSDGKWISASHHGGKQYILKPELIGITLVDPAKPDEIRFIPRRGFSWIFRSWNWLVDHYPRSAI
jgi:hypothetical protein